jgi:hypothetical protein
MEEGSNRSIDITGAFVGHVTTEQDSRALTMLASATIDARAGIATIEYQSSASHGARIVNTYTDPKTVRAFAYEARCIEQMVAADAYRMAPVTPIPKPQRTIIPMKICPTCDGRKRFAGDPCPECLGRGSVPVRD